MFKRIIVSLVCVSLLFSNAQYVQAQPSYLSGGNFNINQLPVPGTMIGESAPFAPLVLKGLSVDPQKPLEFQFIVDTGKGPQDPVSIKKEANRLIKYFMAGLTIPQGELWVNLSPYEKSRITTFSLGQTDLGRDLLAQDYVLKQLTASLIYPEKYLGKEFWGRVYLKAQQQFGTTNVPVNTFNKVWILPDQAQVFENPSTHSGQAAAYVTRSTLKVMLDEDYLAMTKHDGRHLQKIDSFSSDIIREIVIPEITHEVNTGKNFAPLRQIYDAMILAKWYKDTFENGILDSVYTNKSRIGGVKLTDPSVKEQIYQRYLQAYKKGVFNYIKDETTADGQSMTRKYFSGGVTELRVHVDTNGSAAMISRAAGALLALTVSLSALMPSAHYISQRPINILRQRETIKREVDQKELDQEISTLTNEPIKTVRTYQRFGLTPLLLPLSLKATTASAEIRDTMDFIQRHPMFAIGMTHQDMAMINEILKFIAEYPFWVATPISIAVGSLLGNFKNKSNAFHASAGLLCYSLIAHFIVPWVIAWSNPTSPTDITWNDKIIEYSILAEKIILQITLLSGTMSLKLGIFMLKEDLKRNNNQAMATPKVQKQTKNAAMSTTIAEIKSAWDDFKQNQDQARKAKVISTIESIPGYGHSISASILLSNLRRTTPQVALMSTDWVRIKLDAILPEIEASLKSKTGVHPMMSGPDKASIAKDLGGIDLNRIAIKRTGKTIKMSFDPAQLSRLIQGGFEGFTPVIINMIHITSPFELLGVRQPANQPDPLTKV